MPLVRVEVRNEYGLGMPELYTETNREDPKAVLDGVAVAGLVGILRQLGDLAEFAAEVFHGLQEQVLITSSRSHKLIERVHNIEAALPPLEKAILAQRSHLHFAYTAGSHWHTRLRTEQNHFIYSDLPRCIMDSYEDCRDPPRLHKLDKFDIGGPGSCFRRYSDPTYFKRTSAGPYQAHLQSIPREKKARRNKKKKSSRYRTEEKVSISLSPAPSQFRVPETSGNEREVDRLTSFDSGNGSGYIECIFRPSYSTQSEDNNIKEPEQEQEQEPEPDSASIDDNNGGIPDEIRSRSSPYITWDEKLEIIDSTGDQKIEDDIENDNGNEPLPPSMATRVHHHNHNHNQPDEIESETDYYLDALNTIESESETDLDCQTKRELDQNQHMNMNTKDDNDDDSKNFEFHVPEVIEPNQEILPPVAEISPISETTPENITPDPLPEPILTTTRESPQPPEPPVSTSNQPVMFWTNGGLLGLEPSKPPDFGQKTAINEDKDTVVNTLQPESTGKREKEEEKEVNSSRIFEFSNRLLVSGFRRQISLVGNEKLANSVKTDVPENTNLQKGQCTITGIPFREQFISPSSPPLEHMRISFQPIDGFESSSKLKLAFPDGNNNNSNTMFPSFQLVPEAGIGIRDSGSGSDSDDDTFCRSSPYASDDCRSRLSESNSDQWDSGDSPGVKSRELDDAFGRISESESVSSGVRFQQVQSSQSFDIPNFDSLNGYVPEPTPLPPPLPPMEWRGVKPLSGGTPEKEDGLSEGLSFGLNLTPTNPTLPQQPKPGPLKQEHFVQSKKLHVENEIRSTNGKMVEEKEDFLQQIRTKSLNLRRTSTARPTITPAVPTGVKVTAILEKANAIRQVVGSDDGEDNWSDS